MSEGLVHVETWTISAATLQVSCHQAKTNLSAWDMPSSDSFCTFGPTVLSCLNEAWSKWKSPKCFLLLSSGGLVSKGTDKDTTDFSFFVYVVAQNHLNFNPAIRLDAGSTWEAEEVWLDCLSRTVCSKKKEKKRRKPLTKKEQFILSEMKWILWSGLCAWSWRN